MTGPLYVEIAPRTFSVVVRPGTAAQPGALPPRLAEPRQHRAAALHKEGQLVSVGDGGNTGADQNIKEKLVGVSIDLEGAGPGALVGYRARSTPTGIDIEKIGPLRPGRVLGGRSTPIETARSSSTPTISTSGCTPKLTSRPSREVANRREHASRAGLARSAGPQRGRTQDRAVLVSAVSHEVARSTALTRM